MKRRQRAAPPFIRVIAALIFCYIVLYTLHSTTAVGNDDQPKKLLLRLEDVGPGGMYAGPEQLGKLRAVLGLLDERGVSYQITVIPRWVHISKDGTRYDVSIGDTDSNYAQAFVSVLKRASQSGAVLGMHGYTHQVGDQFREDGHQGSAHGNEFDVPDVDKTKTKLYAAERVEAGAELFRKAGLTPRFWEAPHYRSTPEQDEVFRTYFGLHYQADMAKNPGALQPQYRTERNTAFGASTLGAIYVPTPYYYIPDNRDIDVILNQLKQKEKLPSFFFHPYLEFKHLSPVVDSEGNPVVQDGLPLYKYPNADRSVLQRLLTRLSELGYSFIPITDFIPFVPAHSVKVGAGMEKSVRAADVTGDGQSDIVAWDRAKETVTVWEGRFRKLRNEPSGAPAVWAKLSGSAGDVWTMLDDDGDGKSDLWLMRNSGTLERYRSDGKSFALSGSWGAGVKGWKSMYALRAANGSWVIAGESAEGSRLEGFVVTAGAPVPLTVKAWSRQTPRQLVVSDLDGDGKDSLLIPIPHSSRWVELVPNVEERSWKRQIVTLDMPTGEEGVVKTGDFNGDGKEDILFWQPKEKRFVVYRQTESMKFRFVSRVGPWGNDNGQLLVCDLDGDGRKDVAELSDREMYFDTALSFQTGRPLSK